MAYSSLRDFIDRLAESDRLVRVKEPVAIAHEITEIQTRLLAEGGPAVLFENPVGNDGRSYPIPVLSNLFGTVERIAWGMGREVGELRALGDQLAFLRQPEPPGGWREALEMMPMVKTVFAMRPKTVSRAPCQEVVLTGDEVDLGLLPVATCWPGEPAPLITWPLVVTEGPGGFNLGIYRMQVTGRNTTLMRWLRNSTPGTSRPAAPTRNRCRRRSPSAPIPAPSSPPSRRCPRRSRNTSSPGCCAARRSSWSTARPCPSRCRPAPRSSSKG